MVTFTKSSTQYIIRSSGRLLTSGDPASLISRHTTHHQQYEVQVVMSPAETLLPSPLNILIINNHQQPSTTINNQQRHPTQHPLPVVSRETRTSSTSGHTLFPPQRRKNLRAYPLSSEKGSHRESTHKNRFYGGFLTRCPAGEGGKKEGCAIRAVLGRGPSQDRDNNKSSGREHRVFLRLNSCDCDRRPLPVKSTPYSIA